MPARIVEVIHQIHGHFVDATTNQQKYKDDGSLVDFNNLRPCASCGVRFGNDDHDPCIPCLPGVTNACCGHGLPDEVRKQPLITVNEDGSFSFGTQEKITSWGYVQLQDGREIQFAGTLGADRIREAVDAALNGRPLPEGLRYRAEQGDGEAQPKCSHAHAHNCD